MSRQPPLRVLVVDDSAFMRSRIVRDLTAAGLDVVGEARNGREAAAQYSLLNPDAVTMDLTMRDSDGVEGTREILAIDPAARIVMYSIVDDGAVVEEALRNGVAAFVHKCHPEELVLRLLALGPRGTP